MPPLVLLFLSTIAQGLSWIFLFTLFPLTLGDPLSLHLSLVLKNAQFPTQALTSFLSPLNFFYFLYFNKPSWHTYCVPSTVLSTLQVLTQSLFIIILEGILSDPSADE